MLKAFSTVVCFSTIVSAMVAAQRQLKLASIYSGFSRLIMDLQCRLRLILRDFAPFESKMAENTISVASVGDSIKSGHFQIAEVAGVGHRRCTTGLVHSTNAKCGRMAGYSES